MRNSPLKAFAKKSPMQVDSRPVGHRNDTVAGGFGFGAAIEATKKGEANKKVDMWKSARDTYATKKEEESNKEKSAQSKPGSGGQTMIIPE